MAKIMVIDDEQSVCDLMRKLLEPEGFQVITETDAMKSLIVANQEKPDCVLLDIKMPKLDGVEVLSKIKSANKDVQVIMITGYGNLENAMESMKLGAFDYITKPFDLEFLKNLVQRALEKR